MEQKTLLLYLKNVINDNSDNCNENESNNLISMIEEENSNDLNMDKKGENNFDKCKKKK